MIAVGDITVFGIARRRAKSRRPYNNVSRPVLWSLALTIPVGSMLLAATSFDAPRVVDADLNENRLQHGIELPEPVVARSSEPVSLQLRRPLRVTDNTGRQHDLTQLVFDALKELDQTSDATGQLNELLAWALAEGFSDQHIDELLNTAWLRGEFQAPDVLVTKRGRFDTQRLLNSVLKQAAL